MPKVEKLSVSLPVERAKWLRKTAKARKTSISQLVDEAVEARARLAAMDEYLEKHPDVTRDEKWERSFERGLVGKRKRRT
jgi:hypothetical protein